MQLEDQEIISTLSTLTQQLNLICPTYFQHAFDHFSKASNSSIVRFEQKLGEALPGDYRTFLLNLDCRLCLEANYICLSLKDVVRVWNGRNKLLSQGIFDDGRLESAIQQGSFRNNKINRVWWSPKWMPFAEDSCGNLLCIDLQPGPRGKKNQIVSIGVQEQRAATVTEFGSFTNYLEINLGYIRNKQYFLSFSGELTIDRWVKP
jgi:cell wall assembly regulator SMI1